jgi:hypothetical protein
MTPVQRQGLIAAVLTAIVLVVSAVWLWEVLAEYVNPRNATGRKALVQAFILIIAGVVGVIGAVVGLLNLRVARRNLEHNQKSLEENLRIAQQNLEHNQRALEHNQEALRSQLNNQRALEDKRTQEVLLQRCGHTESESGSNRGNKREH